MSILLLIIGLFLFICLVIVHEFGHFIAARRNGVDVEEFGIFFPPRIWSHRMKSGFDFSINALPLGGFVRLKGEHDADVGKGTFGEASLWAKTKIMAAGVTMNLLAAFVIFTILAFVGMPVLISNQFTINSDTKTVKPIGLIERVASGSPAAKAGLVNNDVLTAIGPAKGNQTIINSSTYLPDVTQSLAGKEVKITYTEPSGKIVNSYVQLNSASVVKSTQNSKNPKSYLGISTSIVVQKSTWSAPIVALGLMKQITVLTFQGLWHAVSSLFKGQPSQASSQITGPIGVYVLLKNGSSLGYEFMLFIIAVISLSLAIINILPIPALDGGRLFFTYIPRLIKKVPLNPQTEEWIHGTGLVVLFGLFIVISIVDIRRYFHIL